MKKLFIIWILIAVFALSLATVASSQDKINIVVAVTQGPNSDAAFALVPKIEERFPNIKVTISDIPYTDIYGIQFMEFAAHQSVHDIVMQSSSFFGVYAAKGYLEPLDEYFEKAELIDKEKYNIGDFNKDVLRNVGYYDGKLYALPYMYFPQILAYRADLLEQENIEVPKTMDEFLEAVKKLNKVPGIKGTSVRGQKGGAGGNVYEFALYLYSFGGDFVKNGELSLNTPEAVKALDFWAGLMEYSPSEAINSGAGEVTSAFAGGQLGMILQDADEAMSLQNPEFTDFSDVIKFDIIPEGDFSIVPGQGIPHLGAWSMGINVNSKHKNEAFQVLTSFLSNEADIADDFVKYGIHPRISVLDKFKDVYPNYGVVVKELPGTKNVPALGNWPEVEEIIATALTKRLLGEMTSQEALDEAQALASALK